MKITRMVKEYIKINGWPENPVRVGPATCGHPRYGNKTDCRTAHAYAEAVNLPIIREEPAYAFIYHRPCSMHEDPRSSGQDSGRQPLQGPSEASPKRGHRIG